MALSVRNILHHKQTIERIRRDIAAIKEHYLPAQEPVLTKKQADIQLQIKMAQVLDEFKLQNIMTQKKKKRKKKVLSPPSFPR